MIDDRRLMIGASERAIRFSIINLRSSIINLLRHPACHLRRRRKNGRELIRLVQQRADPPARHQPCINNQLQPKKAFVSLLENDPDLCNKFPLRPGATGDMMIGPHRRRTPHQLTANSASTRLFWQLIHEPHYANRKLPRPLLHFLRSQSSSFNPPPLLLSIKNRSENRMTLIQNNRPTGAISIFNHQSPIINHQSPLPSFPPCAANA
jgi:hypothetical protein